MNVLPYNFQLKDFSFRIAALMWQVYPSTLAVLLHAVYELKLCVYMIALA